MSKVVFDTQVLAWAMRRPRNQREEALRAKATYLMKRLEENKVDILIPSVVLAEFLGLIPEVQRLTAVATIESAFQVVMFDSLAAFEFTRLPLESGNRDKNKADRMILATAMAAGSECIYSEDQDLHDIGSAFIQVNRLPEVPPRQLSLVEQL